MNPNDNKAVFLSYASEDAEAARRIAEALRAEGLDVWLDQSELHGGDAWDDSIRRKIRDCALFVPIVSQHTEARGEGYFRLEWRLAVDRSLLMAEDQPFLVPVAVDGTAESSARVPDAFRARQWIRLRDGMPTAEFAAQVKRLLGNARSGSAQEAAPSPRSPSAARAKIPRTAIAGGVAALGLVIALGSYWTMRKEPVPVVSETPTVKVSAVTTSASPNSIAVLPFSNLSDDKQNEYFSDGISEELLTVLQKISALQVAARSSSFAFKGRNATAQEIGAKLGVSHLVEGSVRKAGQTVRISARLSRAATGEQLWSDAYTRDMKDIFSVQSELAQTIVEQLRSRLPQSAALPSQAQVQVQVAAAAKGGTQNPEAHQLYLQALHYLHQSSLADARRASEFLERAVALDPQFALGWATLSRVAVQRGSYAEAKAEFDSSLATARRAAKRAVAIDASLPSAQLALARVQLWYDYDWHGAARSIAYAKGIAPNDEAVIIMGRDLAYAVGRKEAAVRLAEEAARRDPLGAALRRALGRALTAIGRLDDAAAQYQRTFELNPETPWGHAGIANVRLFQKRFDEAFKEASLESTEWTRLIAQAMSLWSLGKRLESDAALDRYTARYADAGAFEVARVYAHRDDRDRAFEWLDRAYRQRDTGFALMKSDPVFVALRNDPRWDAFLRKIGLADDQLRSLPS